MKKIKEPSLNTKRRNSSKTTRFSGPKLKPRPATSASAHNTWLQHAPKFKTDAEMKTESTNSLIFTREKKLKQTTSTLSRRKSPTSTREKCHTLRLHRKITTPTHSHNLKPRLLKSKASWKPCKLSCNTSLTKASLKKEKKKSWLLSRRKKRKRHCLHPHHTIELPPPHQNNKRNTTLTNLLIQMMTPRNLTRPSTVSTKE